MAINGHLQSATPEVLFSMNASVLVEILVAMNNEIYIALQAFMNTKFVQNFAWQISQYPVRFGDKIVETKTNG